MGELTETTAAPGYLIPSETTHVLALVGGRVDTVSVTDGDNLDRGDEIARIYAPEQAQTISIVVVEPGQVQRVAVAPGNIIQQGDVIAAVQPLDTASGTAPDAVVYVPRAAANTLTVGMPALIAPEGVNVERQGYLQGEVATIGETATNRGGIVQATGSTRLADQLASSAVVEVRLDVQDSWTVPGSSGFPAPNTPITAEITTARYRPLALFFGGRSSVAQPPTSTTAATKTTAAPTDTVAPTQPATEEKPLPTATITPANTPTDVSTATLPTATNTPANANADIPQLTITALTLRVYNGPSRETDLVTRLSRGDVVIVDGFRAPAWWQVQVNTDTGQVSGYIYATDDLGSANPAAQALREDSN